VNLLLFYTDNILLTSADFRYGPKENAKLNEQYHVYVGDLISIISNTLKK
jgi:hypothetical protein